MKCVYCGKAEVDGVDRCPVCGKPKDSFWGRIASFFVKSAEEARLKTRQRELEGSSDGVQQAWRENHPEEKRPYGFKEHAPESREAGQSQDPAPGHNPFLLPVREIFAVPGLGTAVRGGLENHMAIAGQEAVAVLPDGREIPTEVAAILKGTDMVSAAAPGEEVTLVLDSLQAGDLEPGTVVRGR